MKSAAAPILQTVSTKSLRLVERHAAAPIARLVYCGYCSRMVGNYHEFRCLACGRQIWELAAVDVRDGAADHYKPPRRTRAHPLAKRARCAAVNMIYTQLAQADTAARRHRAKYKEEF